MWKNIVEPGRSQMAIWRMRVSCWTPKATKTHSEFVILIPFPLRQYFLESASMWRHIYIDCCLFCVFLKSRAELCRVGHKYCCIYCQCKWKNGRIVTCPSGSAVITMYTTCSDHYVYHLQWTLCIPLAVTVSNSAISPFSGFVLWMIPLNKQQLHVCVFR
jgi:hypothetical protein